MERRIRWLVIPALALLAASCSTVDDMTLGDRVSVKSAPAAHPPPPRPQPPAAPETDSSTASLPPSRAPAKPPVMKTLEPAKLMGLTYEDAETAAGKPAATREEPPATVWRYQTEECVVDVFFYMDLATKQFRAVSYDVKPSKKTADAQRTCAQLAKPRT